VIVETIERRCLLWEMHGAKPTVKIGVQACAKLAGSPDVSLAKASIPK